MTWDTITDIVIFNKPKQDSPISLIISDTYIFETNPAVHLGIRQDASLKLTNRIKEMCQKAKNAFFALADIGMRSDALNPITLEVEDECRPGFHNISTLINFNKHMLTL